MGLPAPWRTCQTQRMDSVGFPRTGPAIRAVLAEVAPDELPEFESAFRAALTEAGDTFDLGVVQTVLDAWWGRAYLRRYPPTQDERALVARFRAGDDTGLWSKDGDGKWVRQDGTLRPDLE